MDTSRLIPILGDNDPLFEISDYTKTIFTLLGGPPNTGGVSASFSTVPLSSGWSNYVGGGSYPPVLGVRYLGHNTQIIGMVKGGPVGSTIGVLPTEFRPKSSHMCFGVAGGTPCILKYNADDGALQWMSGGSATGYLNINILMPLTD